MLVSRNRQCLACMQVWGQCHCTTSEWSRLVKHHSSGAVWESRWQSWAVCPNQPYGFCGRKVIGLSMSLICQPTSEDNKQHNRVMHKLSFYSLLDKSSLLDEAVTAVCFSAWLRCWCVWPTSGSLRCGYPVEDLELRLVVVVLNYAHVVVTVTHNDAVTLTS